MYEMSRSKPPHPIPSLSSLPQTTRQHTPTPTTTMTVSSTPGLHVAIIGGGITGVMLALALSRRGISYTLYERAPGGFAELGAGIGISPNAERALAAIDPRAHAAYKRVASTTGDEADYFTWVDGRRCSNAVVARLLIGVDAFQGGRRADFLEAWARLLPEGRARFGMEIEGVVRRGDGRAELRFRGRSVVEEADIGMLPVSSPWFR